MLYNINVTVMATAMETNKNSFDMLPFWFDLRDQTAKK